ncbi:hypothetical protein EJB05_50047, partial [Eragrostis curvula]
MASVEHEAPAPRARAIQSEEQAAWPVVLPYFPYAAQAQARKTLSGRASETLCAICLEPLRQGQHCSEVPACRHAFHRDCLGVGARTLMMCVYLIFGEFELDDYELRSTPVALPGIPYAQASAPESPSMCAICLEELRQGQMCSEVPACRHIFHEACIRVWARKTNNCPLCRARIVPGTAGGVAAADDMV